jgi:hypothetical protein
MAWMNRQHPLRARASTKRKRQGDIPAGSFAFESVTGALNCVADPARRAAALLQLEASRRAYAYDTGARMAAALDEYFAAGEERGELTDHRPLCCNTDDYLRLAGVPPRVSAADESSWRSLKGVVTHGEWPLKTVPMMSRAGRGVEGCAARPNRWPLGDPCAPLWV